MKCEEVQLKVLEHSDALSAGVQDHLRQCLTCRAFAEVHRQVLREPLSVAPKPELDEAVMQAAFRQLRQQAAASRAEVPRPSAAQVGRRRFARPFQQVLAVAASVILVALLASWFFLDLRFRTLDRVAARDPAAAVWADTTLEVGLVSLEAELALLARGDSDLAGLGGTAASSGAGARERSIDDALFELEMDLFLESEDMRNGSTDPVAGNGKEQRT